MKATVTFAYSKEANARRWNWRSHKYVGADGKDITDDWAEFCGMFRGDAFYRYSRAASATRAQTAVVYPRDTEHFWGSRSIDFDPIHFF